MNHSSKPYFDHDGNPILEKSVIVVADIIGYKYNIKKAYGENRQQALLERFHTQLKNAHPNIDDPSGAKWSVKAYSDNLIIGYRFIGQGRGAFEFPQACYSIGHFQRELALQGVFMRGGIAVDYIHISEHLVFGNVLTEISTAEEKAEYPRIIILGSARNFLDDNQKIAENPLVKAILWKDSGSFFVNYLYPLGMRFNSKYDELVLKHKGHIERNLKQFKVCSQDDRTREKYIWLAKYHNQFCHSIQHYDNSFFLISIDC